MEEGRVKGLLFRIHIFCYFIVVGIVLALLGKQVTVDNYTEWAKKRLLAYYGTLGIAPDMRVWSEEFFPTLDKADGIHRILQASFGVRRHLFLVIAGAAAANFSFSNLFKRILQNFVLLEMSHLKMIDNYLLGYLPELLDHPMLRGGYKSLMKAIKFLEEIQDADKFYVKILRPQEDTQVLNRNNFPKLSATAFYVAQNFQASMKHAKTTHEDPTLRGLVTDYINARNRFAIYEVVSSDESRINNSVLDRINIYLDSLEDAVNLINFTNLLINL